MEGTTMAQVAIFKQIFDKVRNNLNYHWFYSELKRQNVSHYIYYLATENIHLVLENDNTVLIKGQGKVVNVRFSKNKCLIEATLKGFKSGELSFYEYRKNLATAGVFRWITNIHENKRYYYTFDNSLLFTENIQNTTQIFPH
nr:MAG TPA: envelope protein [Caudoviricetes sp.]